MARVVVPIRQANSIRQLRDMLPVAAYLHMLHRGATTGLLPRFDHRGKPTGEFDRLDAPDRIGLARYLIDKVMPDAPKEIALLSPAPEGEDLDAKALAALPTEELRAIAYPQSVAQPPDVQQDLTHVPDPAPAPAPADPAPTPG